MGRRGGVHKVRLNCLVVRALNVSDWGVLDFLVDYVWVLDVMRFGHLVVRLWCLVDKRWFGIGWRHQGVRFVCLCVGLEYCVGIVLHWKSLVLQWNDNRIGMRCLRVQRFLMHHIVLRGCWYFMGDLLVHYVMR